MQKVILDTNVIVSALLAYSAPAQILYELVLTCAVEVCLSNTVFDEYADVLSRDKFSRYTTFKSKAVIVLNKLRDISSFYEIHQHVFLLKDTSDNKFLELAAESRADYLMTGNTLDFTISTFESTRIVTPRDYWDLYKP